MKHLKLHIIIIISILYGNFCLAQLIAVDDEFSIPSVGLLIVEPMGMFENDSLDDETGLPSMVSTLIDDVSHGTLKCVVRDGDTIISSVLGICEDGSFDYSAGANFIGTDIFTYELSVTGQIPASATVIINACSPGPEIFTCWQEASYLAKISELGYNLFLEGFEGIAWDTVRSVGAQSITNRGITWTTNFPTNEITTASGAAISGLWSGFDSNHGIAIGSPETCDIDNPDPECFFNDGLSGSSTSLLYAVGGYFDSPVSNGNISIVIDNITHNVGKLYSLAPGFIGIINTNGFTDFQFREVDGKIGQEIPVFSDDFIIATLEPLANNNPPVFAPLDNIIIDEGEYIAFNVYATDPDDGDFLHFSISNNLPLGASFYDGYDGTGGFNWRPNSIQSGTYPISFTATDNGFPAMSDTIDITITVQDVIDNDLIFENGFESTTIN